MSDISITDFIDFNPKRVIKRGEVAPFVDMAALPVDSRDITAIGEREFKGGGSRFMNGDTLFARITPCLENGKTAKVSNLPDNTVASGSTEFIVMAAKEPEYDEDYVYYLARLPEFRVYAQARMEGTSGRQRVSWQSLTEFKFPFPDKNTRKGAGLLLKKFDDKIELNRQTNQTLEQIAQAIFKSWFVDFEPTRAKIIAKEQGADPATQELAAQAIICGAITLEQLEEVEQNLEATLQHAISDKLSQDNQTPINAEQLKAIAALFPNALVESGLGDVPEGWGVKSLSETVEIKGGGTPKRSEEEFWNGEIPWFSVRDVPSLSDVFVVDTAEKITELGLQKSSTRLLPVGTTIITARGTVGKLALVGTPMCMNQSCYGIFGVKGVGPYFNYFNLRQAVETLQRNTHGAVFDTITTKTFESYSMPMPSTGLLKVYEGLVEPLLKRIETNCRHTILLSELRDTLLPKLLSGELNVAKLVEKVCCD